MSNSAFEKMLEKYAEIVVKVGLNLRAGQRLLIAAQISAAPFVRAVTAQAYQVGARHVDVMWEDEQLGLIRLQNAPRDSFDDAPKWRADTREAYLRAGDALLSVISANPDLLSGQDPDLLARIQRSMSKNAQAASELVQSNASNWLVVSAPSAGWAAKVLPDVPAEQREAKLWDIIFEMSRVKQDDPLAGWNAHIRDLSARAAYLTQKGYTALKYTAPGTDLTLGLPLGHIWHGGGSTSQNGISFTANIPTEEVFTLPHRGKADGVVTASKPLSVAGSLIENFRVTFEGGRVVKMEAEKGAANLQHLLDTDEGARHLGEVALVPYNSPISQSRRLFFNTLFDENAANHIALGRAYRFSLKDGEGMTETEFEAAGGNTSLIHVDFMIGSDQMDVDGVTDSGTIEPLIRAGNWAFTI